MDVLDITSKMSDSDEPSQMLVLSPVMTRDEALYCLREVRGFLNSARAKLLEFKERRGWESLNYPHLTACLEDFFPESRTKLVRELFAAEIERDILRVPIGTCPASHFRSLRKLKSQEYRTALDKAREIAGNGRLTATYVSQAVDELLNSHQSIEETEPLSYKPGDIVRIKCGLGASAQQKAWDGCWGVVEAFNNISSVSVVVGNSKINYTVNELKLESNNRNFKLNCERIIRLWQKFELETVEKEILKLLQQRQFFTDLEMKVIYLLEKR